MKARFTLSRVLLITALVWTMPVEGSAGRIQKQLVTESAIEQVVRRGVLRVGLSTFVPWAMKDKTGKFVGFEIDVSLFQYETKAKSSYDPHRNGNIL